MIGQAPRRVRCLAIASAMAVVVVLVLAMVAVAHEPAKAGPKVGPAGPTVGPMGPTVGPEGDGAQSVTVKLLDFELLDQDGHRVRFKSDVVRDRVVIIDTIYTSCPVVCQILSRVFSSLQDSLGDRLGKDVLLVSISVDPTTDTPPRLKDYAQRWNARPGWLFLTGSRRNVDELLKGLNVYAPASADHPSVVLVGDPRHGRWRRFYGFPEPERVLAEIDALAASRAEAPDRPGGRE